jgi:hypothetical protein
MKSYGIKECSITVRKIENNIEVQKKAVITYISKKSMRRIKTKARGASK